MLSNYYASYLTWYVIMVVMMLSIYDPYSVEPWQRPIAFVLILILMLAVPRKQVKEKGDE